MKPSRDATVLTDKSICPRELSVQQRGVFYRQGRDKCLCWRATQQRRRDRSSQVDTTPQRTHDEVILLMLATFDINYGVSFRRANYCHMLRWLLQDSIVRSHLNSLHFGETFVVGQLRRRWYVLESVSNRNFTFS